MTVSESKTRLWRFGLPAAVAVALVALLWGGQTRAAGNVVISSPTTFESLDGSLDDADAADNGVFTVSGNLTITAGGSITCNDPALPTSASACPMKIVVSGDVEIQAGGALDTENKIAGGKGGDITLIVGGNFTMRGPIGQNPGALITSRKKAGGSQEGGSITIAVGGVVLDTSVDPAVSACVSPTGDALIEAGATITSDSASGHAGDIALYAGHDIDVEGTIRSEGFTLPGRGGAITLEACCDLRVGDAALVRSAGRDGGADRVHLKACVVTVFGLLESTGPAHEKPSPLCTPPLRPGKPSNSTACVEIWSGTTIVVDATGTHNGEINADTALSGGIQGHGWIDLFALSDITIADGTNNDHTQSLNGGGSVPVVHAVHANQYLGNGFGGDIDVESKGGMVTASSNAIQADDIANGAHGGTATIGAGGLLPSGNIVFDNVSVRARGSTGGFAPAGGEITATSYNANIIGNGTLDAGGGGTPGKVTLSSCVTPQGYTGSSIPAALVNAGPLYCGGSPVFPALTPPEAYPVAGCVQACSPVTPTPTVTITVQPLPFQTGTPTPTVTLHPPTVTPTQTGTPVPLLTDTPTDTPTSTPTNTPTNTPTSTPTRTNTPTSTPTDTPTSTNTPTNTPTRTSTPTNTPTATNTPTNTPTVTPTATSTPVPLVNGCTPGYWKQDQHFDSWPSPYVASGGSATLLKDVFSLNGFTNLDGNSTPDDTLLDALNYQGGDDLAGKAQILLRAGVSALLNAASGFGFPLTVQQVKTMVNDALASGDADTIINTATALDTLNNGNCPLN